MSVDTSEYHRLELAIATDPHDSRRVLPKVETRHRRILDVGCGAGQTLIGSSLSDEVLAVGLDTDESAVALGKQLTSAVRFVAGEGESLPFAAGSFDLVICRVALPYMQIGRALAEMSRVTSAGGDLWLVLHPLSMTLKELGSNLARLQLKSAIYRTWVLLNGLSLHFFGQQGRWPLSHGGYETWQTNKAITRALLAAGFIDISITRTNHFVVTARAHKSLTR